MRDIASSARAYIAMKSTVTPSRSMRLLPLALPRPPRSPAWRCRRRRPRATARRRSSRRSPRSTAPTSTCSAATRPDGGERLRHADRQLPAAAGRRTAARTTSRWTRTRCTRSTSTTTATPWRTSPSSSASGTTCQGHHAADRQQDGADPADRRPAPVNCANAAALNLNEKFTVDVVRGDRRTGTARGRHQCRPAAAHVRQAGRQHRHQDHPPTTRPTPPSTSTPSTSRAARCPAKVFVGQRKDPFAVNLGTIFDLVNAPRRRDHQPALINAARPTRSQDKNVTTLALEVHESCLTAGTDPVIGGWTTASLRQGRLLNPNPPKRPPDDRRAAAAPGCRCRAWACRWSTRS